MKLLIGCLLIAAACGFRSKAINTDAANGGDDDDDASGDANNRAFDAAIDAPDVRAAVHVQVIDPAGANLSGNHVVFIDTDATVTDTTTDAGGNTTGNVFPGASVTVVHPISGGYQITTLQAIEPGDNLVVGTTTASTASAGNFTLSWPKDTASGVGGYIIYHPCGETDIGGANTTSRVMASACVDGTQNGVVCTMGSQCPGGSCLPVMRQGCALSSMDVVVVAVDASGMNQLAYLQQSGVAFSSGGSATITDTWHAIPTLAATYTDPTANVATIQLADYAPDLQGDPVTSTMTASATTMFSIARPNAAKATIQTQLGVPDAGPATQWLTQVVDGTATTYSLDLGASLLPWLGNPVFDTTAYTLTTSVDGTQPVDLFRVDAFYVRGFCQGGANSGHQCSGDPDCPGSTATPKCAPVNYTWTTFGPTPGNIQLPTLPASAGNLMPVPPFLTSSNPTHAYACQSDAINGYRPARVNAFDSYETCAQATGTTARRMPGTFNRLSRSN